MRASEGEMERLAQGCAPNLRVLLTTQVTATRLTEARLGAGGRQMRI
jgi:hypothetical protein